MSCERYRALISASLDGDLTPEERTVLYQHLRECRDCAALLADYRQQRAWMRGLGPLESPPTLRAAVTAQTHGRPARRPGWVVFTRGLAAALVVGLLAAWPLARLAATEGGLAAGLARLIDPSPAEAPTPPITVLPVEVPVTVTPAPPTAVPPTATATAAPVAAAATAVPSPSPAPPPTATSLPAPPTATPAPAIATAVPTATPAPTPSATPTSRPVAAAAPTATAPPRPPASATARPANSPTPAPTAPATATKSPAGTATAIPATAAPSATATSTRPPSPTLPAPAVVGSFARIYAENPEVRTRLGLALQNERAPEALTQPFERGAMEWVADGRQIYVLYGKSRTWARFADTWSPDEVSVPGDPPPAGLVLPSRSFGKLWRENATVRERLGWATAVEQSFTGRLQRFERGLMLRSAPTGAIYVLYEDGAWQRFDDR